VSVLIGRERELNTLKKALLSAREGIGGCILLTGEAGIGKSRLIEELKHQAVSEKFTILEGDCFEQEASFPYAPWLDALRGFSGSLPAAEIDELLGPFAPEFVKLLPEFTLLLPQIRPTPLLEPLGAERATWEPRPARLAATRRQKTSTLDLFGRKFVLLTSAQRQC
jgi:predicted ATPase